MTSYPVDENLFYSAPAPAPDSGQPEAEVEYEEPVDEELLHPADFRSFFTLIEDTDVREYHHPTVHYIFSDDDPEILTSAVLETLDHTQEQSHAKQTATSETAQERYVIIDIGADGKSVASASSLSSDWQALKTSITQAPSWGESNTQEDRGLMLKVSGRYYGKVDTSKAGKRRQEQAINVEEMVKIYGERMERLDDVLGRR